MTMTVHPQWIAEMYPGKKGRDHLGLGSVSSDQILQELSPGIYVLTVHPRYFSFYVFLLDEFWRRDLLRRRKAWISFYRSKEFIFSVGAHLCDQPEHGEMGNVVGAQKTESLATQQLDNYDTSTNYIKSELGGYGLYYRTPIIELGLVYPGGSGFPTPVDVPTEKGKEVAAAFREAIKETAYYRRYFDRERVPIDAIRQYIRRACLCQLKQNTAPDRALLLDQFLHGGAGANARRATFRFLLDLASQTRGHSVDQDSFRQLVYFRATEEGATYEPVQAVVDTFLRWRLYQAREYYAFALNAMWYHLCDWGIDNAGDVWPLPLVQFWQYVDHALDINGLAARLGLPKPNIKASSGFQQLLGWVQKTVGAHGPQFGPACTLDSPLQEDRLYRLAYEDVTDPIAMIAGMISLLVIVYLRFCHPDLWLQPEWSISQMGADRRLSLDGFIKQLRWRLQSGPITISEMARWLYNEYIILQHQIVATSKLPENTFRFQREGDKLRFFNLENPLGFTDSRFNALSTTIYELGLCSDLHSPQHRLSPDGKRLLAQGDLP